MKYSDEIELYGFYGFVRNHIDDDDVSEAILKFIDLIPDEQYEPMRQQVIKELRKEESEA